MPVVPRLALAAMVCASVTAARSQTLGEVARQTGAQQKSSDRTVTKLTDKDLPAVSRLDAELRDFRLSVDEFARYAIAREWLLQQRILHRKIDEWLAKAEREGAAPPVIEGMIAQEPVLMEMLDWHKILPHAYILNDVAFNRAVVDATLSDDELSRLPSARAANARFVRDNPRNVVQAGLYHWGEKQKRLDESRGYRR